MDDCHCPVPRLSIVYSIMLLGRVRAQHEHLPHLTLHKANTFDYTVFQTGKGDLMRSSGVVVRAVDEGVLHVDAKL